MTGWNDDEISVDAVAAVGAHRLATIVVAHAMRDTGLAQALRMAMAAESCDDELTRTLASEIDAVRADRRFYD